MGWGGWRKEVIESRIDHQITPKQTEQLTRETKQLHVCCPMLLSGTTEEYWQDLAHIQTDWSDSNYCRQKTAGALLKRCLFSQACRTAFTYHSVSSQKKSQLQLYLHNFPILKKSRNWTKQNIQKSGQQLCYWHLFFLPAKKSQPCRDSVNFLRWTTFIPWVFKSF